MSPKFPGLCRWRWRAGCWRRWTPPAQSDVRHTPCSLPPVKALSPQIDGFPSSFQPASNSQHQSSFLALEPWFSNLSVPQNHLAGSVKIKIARPWPGGSVGWSIIPYTKRFWVRSPVGMHTGGNWSMFLSHFDVSLSLLLPFSLSQIN